MSQTDKTNKCTIAVYVDNKFGVLTRVTSMFTRRGFNIDSLTVGETENPAYSRITLTMSGDGYARDQMLNQLRKLINVRKVQVLEPEKSVARELLLLKLANDPSVRQDVLMAVNVYRASIIDYSPDALSIEVTGAPSKIDAFIELMRPFGIIEMCRTGLVAINRGSSTIFKDGQ